MGVGLGHEGFGTVARGGRHNRCNHECVIGAYPISDFAVPHPARSLSEAAQGALSAHYGCFLLACRRLKRGRVEGGSARVKGPALVEGTTAPEFWRDVFVSHAMMLMKTGVFV